MMRVVLYEYLEKEEPGVRVEFSRIERCYMCLEPEEHLREGILRGWQQCTYSFWIY